MQKTGNVAAAQRQLGYENTSFSLQYSRITKNELKQILDEREGGGNRNMKAFLKLGGSSSKYTFLGVVPKYPYWNMF